MRKGQTPDAHPLTEEQVRALPPGVPTVAVPCPVCESAPGYPCSAPAADGRRRRDVAWLHVSRVPRESFPARFAVGATDRGQGYGAPL
jgi:hypothetical protein